MSYNSQYTDEQAIQFIKDYCIFDNEEKVYTLFAVSRNKLNKGNDIKRHKVQVVLRDDKKIEDKYEDLKSRFKGYGGSFYIYLSLNPRSIAKASLAIVNRLTKGIYDRDYKSLKNVDGNWTSVLMSKDSRFGRGKFMLDIDVKDDEFLLDSIRKKLDVTLERETPNGYHFVVAPFDPRIVSRIYSSDVELKKDDFIFVNSFIINSK